MAELSSFIASAGLTPERKNSSSMPTVLMLPSAAVSPQPMPSDRITHSCPASVLKYVPRSPETVSPFLRMDAMPTETASGSASSRSRLSSRAAFSGMHRRTPSVAESLSR